MGVSVKIQFGRGLIRFGRNLSNLVASTLAYILQSTLRLIGLYLEQLSGGLFFSKY